MRFEETAQTFRARIPDGNLVRCDFRPDFDGHLVTAYSTILPAQDVAATREAARKLLTEIVDWLRAHLDAFEAGDRLQLEVGFPESVKTHSRQIFKCWLPASRLPDLQGVAFEAAGGGFREMEQWPEGVSWPRAKSVADPDPDTVHDRDSFLEFVRALALDRRASVAAEHALASSSYGSVAGGWENVSIESYLEAALAWAEAPATGASRGLPHEPTWHAFAVFLYCGKIYE